MSSRTLQLLLLASFVLSDARAQVSYVHYPDSNVAPNYSAPAGWYPWFTNVTGSRLQTLIPASAFAGIPTGQIISMGGFLGAGNTPGNVTYSILQVRIGPAAVPALTNNFNTNLVPGTEALVLNAPNTVVAPQVASGAWVDFAFPAPYTLPAGQNIVLDVQTQIAPGSPYLLSAVSSTFPRCFAATYTGQATGTLSASSGSKVRFGYLAENYLVATTTGGGAGDLYVSLSLISPSATEGYTFLSTTPSNPLGSGGWFGITPDALTFSLIFEPLAPGDPIHYPVNPAYGFFPDNPLVIPSPVLAGLSGQVWDVVVVLLAPGYQYVGKSNVARLAW